MKSKIFNVCCIAALAVLIFFAYQNIVRAEYVSQSFEYEEVPEQWKEAISGYINKKGGISLYIDGVLVNTLKTPIYMDRTLVLMIPESIVTEAFDCAVNDYPEGDIVIERGSDRLVLRVGSSLMQVNNTEYGLSCAPEYISEKLYLPLEALIEGFGYNYEWNSQENLAILINDEPDRNNLPYAYNYREAAKMTTIKDQGKYGTCWALAALTALETTLRPSSLLTFAADHMSLANSFNLSQNEGGEYMMALAYLVAWQGPVLEEDDEYGDGKTDESLTAAVHVQEAQIIESKAYDTIKKMVYKYGGVQSSIYMSLTYGSTGKSKYYNAEEYAYCYQGENKPNHDVVIIGWDDSYPKENFNADIESDGAFICQNSWGEDFGDDGIFYVSYYDTNIGMRNIVYTKVEAADNYDNIYQTDLCGATGYLGTERDYATFANVYTSEDNESLRAVGFYAAGVDTTYTVYVCSVFQDTASLDQKLIKAASGKLTNAGYYTIALDEIISLNKGQKYAIVVDIETPNTKKPVAVEFAGGKKTETVDLTDGEGYIKMGIGNWLRTEDMGEKSCNICLKAYTDNINSK